MTEGGERKSSGRWTAAIAAAAVAAYLATGFYSVDSDESAVAFVFGRAAHRDVLPGIHWNPPRPFGRTVVAKTATSFVMPLGYRFIEGTATSPISDMWLTGDTNIVSARLTVQYSIRSLADFSLNHESPRELLRRTGERALTRYLVGEGVDGVLTTGRQRLTEGVRKDLQTLLDQERSGITVQTVSIQELSPPVAGAVRNAFQEVQNASADRERAIHEARAYRAQVLAAAEGDAEQMRSEAEGAKHSRIELASGEAERFKTLAMAHADSPSLTEQRLYLESIDRLLPKMKTYVVEPGNEGTVNLRIFQ